jgi:hypothetical protein
VDLTGWSLPQNMLEAYWTAKTNEKLLRLPSFYDVHIPVDLTTSLAIFGMSFYRRDFRQATPLSK